LGQAFFSIGSSKNQPAGSSLTLHNKKKSARARVGE
jgi:hypothetical protein